MHYGPLKNIWSRCTFTAFLLLAVLLYFSHSAKAQEPPFVLLLTTSESKPYARTIAAFKEHLTQYLPQAVYMYHVADSKKKIHGSQFVSKKTKSPPRLIFSLGTKAQEMAITAFPDTPVLATMILHDKESDADTIYSAIPIHFPAEVQLQWLQKFLPEVKRVGILYDPAQNSQFIKEAQKAARKKNLEIVPFKITSAKQLKSGLNFISRNADILLAIPDKTVYSGKTAKEVLLFSYRNRIPFVGLSDSWVKAGALYALSVDYGDLGRQSAGLANKILTGEVREKIEHPEKIVYSLNSRTMDHLHLQLRSDLIKGSVKVFE